MNKFSINAHDVAALIMLNVSLCQIIEAGEVTPDVLDELEYLQPILERIAFVKEKGSLQH